MFPESFDQTELLHPAVGRRGCRFIVGYAAQATLEAAVKYQLAELNIAKFRLPLEHPINRDFIANLDHVNAVAESQPGFVWRLIGAGNNALDLRAFDDPDIAVNMSVWTDLAALANFVYRN